MRVYPVMKPSSAASGVRDRTAAALGSARVLAGTGLLSPVRPDRLIGMGRAALRYGLTVPAGYAAAAARDPHVPAVVDDDGVVTFAELHRSTDALAGALRAHGLAPGDAVGLLARNGRGFVEGMLAASKAGLDVVYLNTSFAPAQLADVVARERVRLVLVDDDLADAAETAGAPLGTLRTSEFAALVDQGHQPPRRPGHASRHVLLTSGTTGSPRGAARSAAGLEVPVAVFSRIPLRRREATVVTCPLFHAWGFAHLGLAMLLGSTLVLSRRFDAELVLAQVAEQRATAVVAVPVLLARLLDVDADVRAGYDLSTLRVVALSGSALPPSLATRALDAFGEVVYDLYGSTEVGYAAIATPADLRAAPGTVGTAPFGVTVEILGADDAPVADGETGRIFVGSGLAFAGYTSGEDKARVRGLVSSGDTGRRDAQGRLFVAGRDDDMVITGGENVFPGEIEDALRSHPDVADVCVAGVPDEAYGARLVAWVVPRDGASPSQQVLADHVGSRLARFKVPREVHLVAELPRNATGKVLRRELIASRDG